jgi:hypothetical protein
MRKNIYVLMLFLGVVLVEGCTDLQEEVLDESLTGNVTNGDVIAGTLAPAYASLSEVFLHTRYFALQEISTDEAILPYRGGTDWGDNNIYIDLHRHTYTPMNGPITNTWNYISQGITRSVIAVSTVRALQSEGQQVDAYLAEARGLRGYYSMLSLDLFGIVMSKDTLNVRSRVLRGAEAVNYIEQDLLAAEAMLDDTNGPGRITKSAAQGLLARLYLNAPVYRNPNAETYDFRREDMEKVVEYCDKVIATGKYALSAEFFEIFDDENHTNKELVFAIDQRALLNGNNRMAYFSLSGDQFPLPQFVKANGTDGPGITPEFYHSWLDAYEGEDPATKDMRFYKRNLDPTVTCIAAADFEIDRGILRGQQYGLQTPRKGDPFVRCAGGVNYVVGPLFNNTRGNTTQPVIFTEEIDYTTYSGYSSGYRVLKYEFSKTSDDGRAKGEFDIVLLRLADIYMMRAEAKLRMDDAAGALQDVNTVRAARTARIGIPPLESIDLDIMFRERGFEFYFEMQRRTDMIRFGKYEDAWTEKTDSDPLRRLFPIPQTAIDGASEFEGFLEQNDGY